MAHFDMLGMRSLSKRNPDLAWEKLSALSNARDERMNLGIQLVDTGELISDKVWSFIFSDTMVAFTRGGTQNDCRALVLLTTELFTLALHYGIPLRGGIAYGRFDFNLELNLFSGPALVDAYELGESSQWLGIVLDDETARVATAIPLVARDTDAVIKWNVPLRDVRSAPRYVVNWIASHMHNYAGPVPLAVEPFYEGFAPLFGPFCDLDQKTRAKYENTVVFFNTQWDSLAVSRSNTKR